MNYEKLKEVLANPNANIWINGKKTGKTSGVDIWQYEFGGLGTPKIIVRGADTNNLKSQFESADFGVFVDGAKLNLDKSQYLDLLGMVGYRFSVVQPAKIKERNFGK